jgi:hypothetical protein
MSHWLVRIKKDKITLRYSKEINLSPQVGWESNSSDCGEGEPKLLRAIQEFAYDNSEYWDCVHTPAGMFVKCGGPANA